MKASYNWIAALAPGLPGDARAVAARFTAAGLEVEAIHEFGAGAESCVLAWVVDSRKHPTKSGLKLVKVDRGGGHIDEIVCGAPNVPEAGAVVVLAPLGTHLPAKNMTIARRDIGGVVSEGMLCSEAELGLSDDAAGIIVFPAGFAEPGAKLVDVVPEARDTIFEIGLTPNRPDGLGHIGLAREAAALAGIPWKMPAPESPVRTSDDYDGAAPIAVRIDDADRCPHYGAAIVSNAVIAPSPPSVRYRLSALGVRAISNVVDVTNMVMLEHGHPMHAFDADKIRGGTIIVRRAVEGEKLVTLDGTTRTLAADDLVIADSHEPVALAGVMGGLASEITAATKRIVLECAYFDPRTVRRTARRHGLHSESSHRFERGIDHGDTPHALEHALGMTCRLTNGIAAKGLLVKRAKEIPPVHVTMRATRMSALLGIDVPLAEAKSTLERLGFACTSKGADAIDAVVPTHRPDVTREADVIDEVIRVRGMGTIPAKIPAIRATRAHGGRELLFRRVRAAATSLGLSEALTFGFTSRKKITALRAHAPLAIENPITEELDVMRTSLLPGLLDAVSRARRHGTGDVRLFTTGSIFLPRANDLPEERATFAAVLAGERPAYLTRPEPVDVYDTTGLATSLLLALAPTRTPSLSARPIPHLHPRGSAEIHLQNARIGSLGPIHPDVADAFDLGSADIMIVELDLAALAALPNEVARYSPIPRHPSASRDIALVVKTSVPAGEILGALREAAGPLAVEVHLFDRFTGGSIPADHASLAFHVVYRAEDRTLTDAEVDTSHAKVVSEMQRRFGASLRQ